MFGIIGIIVVFGAVIGGYLMEHGNLQVLIQPAELVIIGGAAAGTVLIANPPNILKGILGGLKAVFGSSKFGESEYLSTMTRLYAVMQKARKGGLTALEKDVEEPSASQLFNGWNHHVRDFVCDTLRMAMTGGPTPHELDQMMELDMEVHHHHLQQPVTALNTVADSLPGLGIWQPCWASSSRWAARRSTGRDRPQSRRGTGRHLSRHPAVLRASGSDGI